MRNDLTILRAAPLIAGLALLGSAASAKSLSAVPEESEVRSFGTDAQSAEKKARELTRDFVPRGTQRFIRDAGLAARMRGDASGAKRAFESLIRRDPSDTEGYRHLADASFYEGDYAGAAALYTRALETGASNPAFLLSHRAEAFLEMGRPDAALEDIDRALAAGPDSSLLVLRARALLCLKRPGEAARAYAAAWKTGWWTKTLEDTLICRELEKHGPVPAQCGAQPPMPKWDK